MFDTDLSQDSFQAQFFWAQGLQAQPLRSRSNWAHNPVRDGMCVDPSLCCGTSQGKYGSCTKDLVGVGETVGKIGEKSEMGERELVNVVSVKWCKE